MTSDGLRILTVGDRYRADAATDVGARLWPALVAALRGRGDTVSILTTDDSGPELDGVDRSLHWFRAADGSWRRPARLEASRISRRALLRLGEIEQSFRPQAVVWVALGGLPLTLAGATGLPELACVLDDWPVYGPQVDLRARQEGWDPAAVTAWTCGDVTLRDAALTALGDRVDPAAVHVDPPGDAAGWAAAVTARLDLAVAARPAPG
ncbi:hypothetical protein [Paraconexibacter sp. AEG42_29]|uniref:hypothetical protein n=1 Tax=Paraconexibacter sp. AEG42_29 TaxID=2997339 RepID=UPI00339D9827